MVMNGLYQASNMGNIKTLEKEYFSGRNKCTLRKIESKIMKQRVLKRTGYKMIKLCKNNKTKHFSVHRLIAQTFIPNPNNLPQVNHIDGNKLNNNINNLEWVTGKENIKHAIQNNLIDIESQKEKMRKIGKAQKGKNNNSWRGYINVFDKNKNFIKQFETLSEVKEWLQRNTDYKVSVGNICTAIKKQNVIYGYRYSYDAAEGERLGGWGSTSK